MQSRKPDSCLLLQVEHAPQSMLRLDVTIITTIVFFSFLLYVGNKPHKNCKAELMPQDIQATLYAYEQTACILSTELHGSDNDL